MARPEISAPLISMSLTGFPVESNTETRPIADTSGEETGTSVIVRLADVEVENGAFRSTCEVVARDVEVIVSIQSQCGGAQAASQLQEDGRVEDASRPLREPQDPVFQRLRDESAGERGR